jgi:uncharacterized protein involved in outer membrane biogenesis
MKKVILIVCGLVVVGFIGLLVLAMMTANSLIASLKPEVERLAGQTLGVDVSIADIGVSVFPSTHFMLKDLSLSKPSAKDERLALKEVRLDLRLLDLLRKRLSITTLAVVNPDITLVREASGMFIAGLPRGTSSASARSPGSPAPSAAAPASNEASAAAPRAPIDIALEEIRIENGIMRISDKVSGQDRTIDSLNLRAGVVLAGSDLTVPSFDFSARAAEKLTLSASGRDITLRGETISFPQLSLGIVGNTVTMSGSFNIGTKSGTIALYGKEFSIPRLLPLAALATPELHAMVTEFAPIGSLGFSADASIDGADHQTKLSLSLGDLGAKVGPLLLTALRGDIKANADSKSAALASDNLSLALGGQPVTAKLKTQVTDLSSTPRIILETLNATLFSGTADITGNLLLNERKPLQSAYTLRGIEVSEALSAIGQAPGAQLFSATVEEVKGTAGFPLSGVLPAALTAQASVSLSNAQLKGFNLAGAVLRAVKDLPFLQGALYESVPADQRGAVDSPDTVLSKVTGNFQVSNAVMSTPDLVAQSALFTLEADGTIGFDATINLNATILFNPTFSASLVTRAKDLKVLLDSQQCLVIPLALKGKAAAVVVVPNMERLLRTGVGKVLEEKASDFLGKALGGKKEGSKRGLGSAFGF